MWLPKQSLVLIETYWNVKRLNKQRRTQRQLVLIETYWNVKNVGTLNTAGMHNVLIETYWNVKDPGCLGAQGAEVRINRNILECKAMSLMLCRRHDSVLIETYWNVKVNPSGVLSISRLY